MVVAEWDAFMAQASMLGVIRTLWRADDFIHVKQLLFAGTTVQQVYCDLCELPHDYNRFTDVMKWLCLGIALGLAYYRLPRDWIHRLPGSNRCLRRKSAAVKRDQEEARP